MAAANVDALAGHRMVGFHSSATRALLPLEFTIDGVVRNVNLPASVAVNSAESLVAAGRLGLGLIQVPHYHIESDLEQGTSFFSLTRARETKKIKMKAASLSLSVPAFKTWRCSPFARAASCTA